jgi:DNA-binding NarL/FixJ family response regulator
VIAAQLGISLQTVKWHVSRLLSAHGVETRTSLVREALRPATGERMTPARPEAIAP